MDDNRVQREPHSLNCFCCRTTTAAKIAVWLDVILSIAVIIPCIVNFHETLTILDDLDVDANDAIKTIYSLILIHYFSLLLTSIILLVGIGRKSSPVRLPYIIIKALQVLGSILFNIWLYNYGVQSYIGFWFIGILWKVYQLATTTHCFIYFHGLGSQTGFADNKKVSPCRHPVGT